MHHFNPSSGPLLPYGYLRAFRVVQSSMPTGDSRHRCYAQDERTVRLGAFECEGGCSGASLATAVSGKG